MTGRDGFGQVLHGEWTKLRSVRSTAWCLVLLVGLTVLLSVLGAAAGGTDVNSLPRYADQFRFVHQPMTGDGTVVARVLSQEATGPWAKAGIILKDGTTSGSPYAALMVTPGHGVRMSANFQPDLAGSPASGPGRLPRWLKLVRTGSSVTGYESADGTAWQQVATVPADRLPATVEVGLFVASPDTGTYHRRIPGGIESGPIIEPSTAMFDQVSVTGGDPEAFRADAVPTDIDIGKPGEGLTVDGSGTFTVTGEGDLGPHQEIGDDDIVQLSLTGVVVGLMAVVVLGVLFATSEYKTGLVRTTFAASPRRGRVLAAKAMVLAAAVFAAGLVASVAAFQLGQPALRASGFGPPGYPRVSLTDPTVLRAVVGTALFLTALALFSLGLGALLRRSAPAITAGIGLVVVPWVLDSFLPLDPSLWLRRLTPVAGLAIQQTRERFDAAIGPWAGLAVLAGYAAVALAAAAVALRKRDA